MIKKTHLAPEDRLRSKLQKDARFKNFCNIVDVDTKLDLPLADWRTESRLLHRSRKVSKLSAGSSRFGRNLIEAVTQENAARSRMTEMLVEATRVNKLYSRYISALTDYFSVEYAQDLASVCKTLKERERFTTVFLEDYIDYQQDVEDFISELQFYITDIDKAGYGIKAMSEVFTAIFRAEGRVDSV